MDNRTAFTGVILSLPGKADAFGIGQVEENTPGYYPREDLGTFETYEAAMARADKLNDFLKLDPTDAAMIVASSFRAQNQAKRKRKANG